MRLSILKEEGEMEWGRADDYSFCKMDSHCQCGLANPRRLCWSVRAWATITFFILGC
jgi:hypothetical protein